MKTAFQRIGISLLLSLVVWEANSQKQDEFGYFLKGVNIAVIPFELHSNLIIVPVQINNSDTLHFILDTGVSTTIITDPLALKNQTVKYTRTVRLAGAGEGKDLEASVVINNTIKMGKMRATYQNMVVLREDILHLSEFVGVPIHGIFGYEIFNNFVVTIDFVNHEIFLTKPNKYKYRPSKGEKYPIFIENAKPYADIVALVDNGKELPIRVMLDTGAGHALLLDRSKDPQIKLPTKVIQAQLGRGLSGVINGSLGRLKKIRFGKFELNDIIASYPDSLSFGMKLKGNERQGNVGCELLRRFKVTFNYSENYIVLKPTANGLKETFEHDMSGVEVKANKDDLRKYYIENVVINSPAWAAGLQEGDELLFVNNQPAPTMSISEIYILLQKGEGREITMLVRRESIAIFVKFKLKRMI